MIDAPTKPTLAECLASASNSRDLSFNLESRGDVDYLIAANLQRATMGRLVYQLMAEWDARPRQRELSDADIETVAQQMPRLVKKTKDRRGERAAESLDIAGARATAAQWKEQQRFEALTKLPAYRKLANQHAGLIPWVLALGVESAGQKLADVLLWWCDRRCQSCGGTNLCKGKTCKICHGFGTRDVPHGAEGLQISQHIATLVDNARAGTASTLKRMKKLKEFASGRS